jgi:hypothetical protein
MDNKSLPAVLRKTEQEMMECCNNPPFRNYYKWIGDIALTEAKARGCTTIVELAAGPAPITRRMLRDPRKQGIKFVINDISPNRELYEKLGRDYPENVVAEYEPVDLMEPMRWPKGTLLVLSGAFHHIPLEKRPEILSRLRQSADALIVAEPLRRTLPAILLCVGGPIPALLAPLLLWRCPGVLRRLIWCWLVPVVPFIFAWDGVLSCLNMSTEMEWNVMLANDPYTRQFAVRRTGFCTVVTC